MDSQGFFDKLVKIQNIPLPTPCQVTKHEVHTFVASVESAYDHYSMVTRWTELGEHTKSQLLRALDDLQKGLQSDKVSEQVLNVVEQAIRALFMNPGIEFSATAIHTAYGRKYPPKSIHSLSHRQQHIYGISARRWQRRGFS